MGIANCVPISSLKSERWLHFSRTNRNTLKVLMHFYFTRANLHLFLHSLPPHNFNFTLKCPFERIVYYCIAIYWLECTHSINNLFNHGEYLVGTVATGETHRLISPTNTVYPALGWPKCKIHSASLPSGTYCYFNYAYLSLTASHLTIDCLVIERWTSPVQCCAVVDVVEDMQMDRQP